MRVLSNGQYGRVHEGTLQGRRVAVKETIDKSPAAFDDMLQEAKTMASFHSEFLLTVMGVVQQPELRIVMEFAELGDLRTYLLNHPKTLHLHQRAQIAADCANGLAYLAMQRVVHRDFAARNVMLTSDLRAKVADFGLSRNFAANTVRVLEARSRCSLGQLLHCVGGVPRPAPSTNASAVDRARR